MKPLCKCPQKVLFLVWNLILAIYSSPSCLSCLLWPSLASLRTRVSGLLLIWSLPLSNQVSCLSDFWSLGLVPLTIKTARKYKISVTSQYLNKLDIWCMDLPVSWVNQINICDCWKSQVLEHEPCEWQSYPKIAIRLSSKVKVYKFIHTYLQIDIQYGNLKEHKWRKPYTQNLSTRGVFTTNCGFQESIYGDLLL